MNCDEWFLPEQLAHEIVETCLDWESALIIDCEEFHKRFTLHDSYWIGIHIDTAWDGEATAVIRFDPIWNSICESKTPKVTKWPFILIKFSGISSIEIEDYEENARSQRGIAICQTEKIDSNYKVRTAIQDHYGGKIILKHDDILEVLMFRYDGTLIKLNS